MVSLSQQHSDLVLLDERDGLIAELPIPAIFPRVLQYLHTLRLELQAQAQVDLLALGQDHKAGGDTRQGAGSDANKFGDFV